MKETEQLVVQLEARRDFERNMQKANRTAQRQFGAIERRSAESSRRLQQQWATAGRAITRGLGVLGVGVGFAGVQRLLNDLDEVGKQAKRTGVDVESLQALIHAAELSGSDSRGLVRSFERLNEEIAKASTRSTELGEILSANGVNIRDFNGELRSTKGLYFDIADLIKNAANQQEATLIAPAGVRALVARAYPAPTAGCRWIARSGERRTRCWCSH